MGFDYHLNVKEQKGVEKHIPTSQAKIHIAMRSNFVIDQEEYKKGAIALSEHMIILLKKRMFGNSFKHALTIHLFDITMINTKDDETLIIETNENKIIITSEIAMRLARNVLRNYLLSTKMMPASYRFSFRTHCSKFFPPFSPNISISQGFQFSYNAYCSYFRTEYHHQIVQFFHSQLTAGNPIYNLSEMPFSLIDVRSSNHIDIHSITYPLQWCKYCYGICCHDRERPDLLKALAPVVQNNPNLKLVSLTNCGINTGLKSIAQAITKNKLNTIQYWDLSDNPLKNHNSFFDALRKYENPIFYLNMSNTGIHKTTSSSLFNSILSNTWLTSIEYLYLDRNDMSNDAINLFSQLITKKTDSFKGLSVSGDNIQKVLEALANKASELKRLEIPNSTINSGSLAALIQIINQSDVLAYLDISKCKVSIDQIVQIVNAIKRNSRLCLFHLVTNELKLNKNNLVMFLDAFNDSAVNLWQGLYLDNNDLCYPDLEKLYETLEKLPNLTTISLNGNFDKTQPNIGKQLTKLLKLPCIQSISLRGTPKRKLGDELKSFLTSAVDAQILSYLDIRDNQIGDNGVKILSDLLKSSHSLRQVFSDCSIPTNVNTELELFNSILKCENLISTDFPFNDIFGILNSFGNDESKRKKCIEQFSEKQWEAQTMLSKHMAECGMHSFLSLKRVNELDRMVDEMVLKLFESIQDQPIHVHSAITQVLGLPLPHQEANEKNLESGGIVTEVETGNKKYGFGDTEKLISETADSNFAEFQTLQFNSLMIRRPEMAKVLSSGSLTFAPVYDEEEDDHVDRYSAPEGNKLVPTPSEIEFEISEGDDDEYDDEDDS